MCVCNYYPDDFCDGNVEGKLCFVITDLAGSSVMLRSNPTDDMPSARYGQSMVMHKEGLYVMSLVCYILCRMIHQIVNGSRCQQNVWGLYIRISKAQGHVVDLLLDWY